MDQIVFFAVLGLGTGALVAGMGLGVVLTYRGAGVINLATGAISMVAGYAAWTLSADRYGIELPLGVAFALSIVVAIVVGLAVQLLVFRPLQTSSPLARMVASLGVLLLLQAGIVLLYGTSAQPLPSILPKGTVHIFGAVTPVDRFWLAGIVVAATAALAALYRFTRFGVTTRAVAENEEFAMLAGLSTSAVSSINVVLASAVAGALGVLAAPLVQLDSSTLPLQIAPALGAALLARFTSFWITCAAGLAIGALQSVVYYFSTQSWFPTDGGNALPGLPAMITLAVIIAALYVRGAGLPGRGDVIEERLPAAPRPERLARPAIACAVVGVAALIVFPYDFRQALVLSIIGVLVCLSLVVIAGFVGQISLMQVALAGVCGFFVSHAAVDWGLGFPVGPLLGTVAATLLGLGVGASALRVRGISLAVVTLAAAVAIEQFGFTNSTWGAGPSGSPVPYPHLFGIDLGGDAGFRGLDGKLPSPVLGFLALAVTIALCLLVSNVRRGTLGQRMLAVRSNERAAAAAGVNVRTVKLAAFGISSFIAGTAGWLYAYNFGSVSAVNFSTLAGLGFVAFAYVGGITMVSGAVIGGFIVTGALMPYAVEQWTGISGTWTLLIGAVLLLVNLIFVPGGIAGKRYADRRRRLRAHDGDRHAAQRSGTDVHAAAATRPNAGQRQRPAAHGERSPNLLTCRDLSVSFGGVQAVSGLNLDVARGQLVALIGPNGAGKTTSIDALTGFVRATGTVELGGHDISSLSPDARAQRGLVRTWQSIMLFDDLTVRENLAVAAGRPSVPQTARELLGRPPSAARAADAVLERLGLSDFADAMPFELSQGTRKIVGVARAMAADPIVVCLDEPAAGLDTRESRQLGTQLRAMADDGTAVLLVDHDMGLVLSISDWVVVLEFGKVIAAGPPDQIRADPRVIEAYLGSSATDVADELQATATGMEQ